MKVSATYYRIGLTVCLLYLMSCAPGTKITGSWKEPSAPGYKDFFVTVFSQNLPARTALENDLDTNLTKQGATVTQSLEIFPANVKFETETQRSTAVEKILSLGYDAIITVSIVRKDDDTHYVPGSAEYAPMNYRMGYYGSFGGYYDYGYSNYANPGHFKTDVVYFAECNVYDAKTKKPVWSAQSETFNPANIKSASRNFSMVMVNAMKKDKLIFKKSKN